MEPLKKATKKRLSVARRDGEKIARLVSCGEIDEAVKRASAGDRDLEDDLRQEAFLTMLELAAKGTPPAEAMRKAVGAIIRESRSRSGPTFRPVDIERFTAPVEGPEEPHEEDEEFPQDDVIRAALRTRVRMLPEVQRKAIVKLFGLFDQEQKAMSDIAAEMGTKRQSVNVSVERALKNLRREMYPFFGPLSK